MPFGINELEILSEPVEADVYIVDKILPPGVTLLCGHQKIGKSWLALKLCLCATRGVDLWGYKTKHCKALYCCLEDTRNRIRKRYDALVEAAEELQGTTPAGWLDFRFHQILAFSSSQAHYMNLADNRKIDEAFIVNQVILKILVL